MKKEIFFRKLVSFTLFLLISLGLGIYSGIKNANDTTFQIIEAPNLKEDVKVYRDENGIASILARNFNDLFFAQGYEIARDRTWQLEFYNALINGRLSEIFGSDLLKTDKYIRSLGFDRLGEDMLYNLSSEVKSYIESYVAGINLYFENHAFSLPWEFQLLNLEPLEWKVTDVLAMQGLFSYLFSFDNAYQELFFGYLSNKIGLSNASAIMNINPSQLKDYSNSTKNFPVPQSMVTDPISDLLGVSSRDNSGGNIMVLGASKIQSKYPVMLVQPINALGEPNLWYQTNLKLSSGFSVQGFTIPGIPFVLIGHNNVISWGFNPSHLNEIDLIYLQSNNTHYYDGSDWVKFQTIAQEINVADSVDSIYNVKISEYGPVLNISGYNYAIHWSLYNLSIPNTFMDSMFQLNYASSIQQANNTLDQISSPNLNYVFADIAGNIAIKQVGVYPIRTFGNGLFPLNASVNTVDWNGYLMPNQRDFEINPSSNYYILADNNPLSTNTTVGVFDSNFRYDRMLDIVNHPIEFSGSTMFNASDVFKISYDTLDLASKSLVVNIEKMMANYTFSEAQNSPKIIYDILRNWDFRYDTESNGASVFEVFRYFLTSQVFSDELGVSTMEELRHELLPYMINLTDSGNFGNYAYDEINKEPNTSINLIVNSLEEAYGFLSSHFGSKPDNWQWGDVHQVRFNHIIGQLLPVRAGVNLGPYAVPGSDYSINSFRDKITDTSNKVLFGVDYGSSVRFTMEVSPEWNENLISFAPGVSGHVTSDYYSDEISNWLNGISYSWSYNPIDIILLGTLSAQFIRGG